MAAAAAAAVAITTTNTVDTVAAAAVAAVAITCNMLHFIGPYVLTTNPTKAGLFSSFPGR